MCVSVAVSGWYDYMSIQARFSETPENLMMMYSNKTPI